MRAKPKVKDGAARCEAIRERLGMSRGEFSLALGYCTDGGYAAALSRGVSQMLLLAAERLEQMHAATIDTPPTRHYLLLTLQDGVCIKSEPVAIEPGFTLGGKSYLLIEQQP